ncbi:tetratricopeptide repeat protein [Bdellovibrionota bacterium FG-1]
MAITALATVIGLFSGCATHPTKAKDGEDLESLRGQVSDLRTALTRSQTRIDSLETRLTTLGERLPPGQGTPVLAPTQVGGHPSDAHSLKFSPRQAANDPEAGFLSDEPVQNYRRAAILRDAGKYSEAILAFSAFLETYPDHPLAGNAQFLIGDSYFKQKEYKLACTELEKVLTSYDRSPRVSDALFELSQAEDRLKLSDRAARHRQLLTSLFPQSPAAAAHVTEIPVEPTSAPQQNPSPATPSAVDLPPPAAALTIPTAPVNAADLPNNGGKPQS